MGNVIVYIATSLDGFIARKDDDISWLDPFTAGGEDYGYAEFIKNVGTAIMGARTWEQSLLHPERLLGGIKTFVITRRELPLPPATDAVLWHGTPADLVARIRKDSEKDIYVVGGGQVISQFIDEGLVDEIRLFIVPVLLKEGVPLFSRLQNEIHLRTAESVVYPGGIVKLRYFPA